MKNIFLVCMLFTFGKPREISGLTSVLNRHEKANHIARADSSSIISGLYKSVKILPSINEHSFSYKYAFNPKTKIVKINCIKKVGDSNVEYHIELKDTKGLFNQNNFSVGDDYKYITSYFILDGVKLPLDKVHALNSEDDFLTQISNIWGDDKSSIVTKLYKIGIKKILLIKGINPFCNGHNCTDYVVYILQKENGKGSVNAIHLDGTNNPYDFNNMKLFNESGYSNPVILVPKTNRAISSKLDFKKYKILFESLKE